ncbi:helix-turn-helix domain-containing protein [Mumia sp. DW29H23]|uniref:helix-turn-helix domain-containing protein n=1 Tax=Mumia sp. DW29H23 TaxID=3421241 RepID=UPI003D69B247
MQMYNALVEVARKGLDEDFADDLIAALEHHHPAVGESPRGWVSARISLPAESLAQASTTAVALVEAATGAAAIACEVATETEFDAREGFVSAPELVSVTQAAESLGVSRQAVLDRIARRTLPATKVGRDYVIPAEAIRR